MANKWCTLRSKAHSPFFGYIYNQATASKNPQTNCQMIRNFLYVSFSRLRPIISLHSTSTMWKALKSSRESGWRLAMLINCLLRFWCRHSAVEFLMPLSVTRAKRVMGVAVPRSTGRDGCIEIQQVPSRNARWFEGEQWTMAMFVHQCCSQVVRFRALLTSCKSTCFFYHVFSRMLDTPFNQLPRDGPFTKMSCLPLCLRDATKHGPDVHPLPSTFGRKTVWNRCHFQKASGSLGVRWIP